MGSETLLSACYILIFTYYFSLKFLFFNFALRTLTFLNYFLYY